MAELHVGTTFAEHEIRAVAGRGGMGIVYRALDLRLKREVALKVIAPKASKDAEFRARFQRECEVAASIHHPNLIPVYTAGEEDGRLYVTMRFVEGADLSVLLRRQGRLEPTSAASLIAQVGAALDAAHAYGIVHRDVKPANVLLDGEHALLTDFGLQRDIKADARITEPGTLIGTFDYIAPEQLEDAAVDARTDVYALGCVLYEALTGEVPFPVETPAAKMFAHLGAPPPSVIAKRPDAGDLLEAVVLKAMAKDPGERFASAGELGQAALEAVGPATVTSHRIVRIPLPPALIVECGRQPFVGRTPMRRTLDERYAAAAAGERQFVLISGEPGIGKTRLASEAASAAHAQGATVLYGRADAESLVPYQPFVNALQHYVSAHGVPSDLDLGELAPFIPQLRRPGAPERPSDPEARRYLLFEAVTRLLGHAARAHPTVLILDDIQWLDASTSLLLGHLLQDPEPMRLLVLGTIRAGESGPQLRRMSSFERIELTGFDARELEAFVAESDPRFIDRLRAATEGNPFFVEETMRSLHEAGHADLDAIGVPEGVKEMVGRRLARLDREVLAIAAVIGRDFRLDVLETLTDHDALEAVERACQAGLVREADEVDHFLFAHALVRETLYEQMSASRRVRLHRRIGEALEAGGNPAELAHHFSLGRHDRKAREYTLLAAEQAAEALRHEEAARHYRELDADLPILLKLGTVELRAGQAAARDTFRAAADLARMEHDPRAFAQAALGFNHRQGASGIIDREGIALLEEAAERLDDSPLLAHVLARLADCLHFAGVAARTDALSARALEMARRSGDREALAATLVARHTALLHVKHLDERLRLSAEIVASSSPELLGIGLWWYVYDLMESGQVEAARTEHAKLVRLAGELRQPLYQHFAASWEFIWGQMTDDPVATERACERTYELGLRAAARDTEMIHASQLVTIRLMQGRLPEFVEIVQRMADEYPELPVWRAALMIGLLVTGRKERGRALYEEFTREDFETLPHDMIWFTTLSLLGWACQLLRDRERAPIIYRTLLPYRERTVQDALAANWGSVERFLGSLAAVTGDYETACEHFEIALERNLAWGMRQAVRLTRTEYAQVLLARGAPGDADHAISLLRAVLDGLQAAGLPVLAEFVRVQLAGIERAGPGGPAHRPELN
jgi:tRNA A-37 threonylcarbamoyl transferase component Bud32/tetratricopeptide (TPR) repeat protein